MKIVFTTFLVAFITSFAYSQDIIQLKDGTKIEGKILEISSSSLKFYKSTQPNGPLRILELYEISEIVYSDGTAEKFNISPPKTATVINPEKPIKPYRDPFFKRGFFIDRIYGLSIQTNSFLEYQYSPEDPNGIFVPVRVNSGHFNVGLKIGNKWYFGANEKWRPGLQVTWIRFSTFIGGINGGGVAVSPINLGMSNVIKLNEKRAIEANFQVGPTFVSTYIEGTGFSFSIEGKYRIKKLALGFDYQYIRASGYQEFGGFQPESILNNISLTAGFKF